ncbi:hypothetical protein niasHT_036760 [Heterodera trifolii]|uniref:Enhancer of polycomb-like protein n=1 Tax=Heterodera trifolii TaxID=157864 RepID=A0ABD2IUY9_9BILA
MSNSIKFGFRPRALDVTKKLPIRIRKCRKRSPKVKRTVAVAPSGMEKEEEMESHLQQAILAQKATSAGDTVENHVIPTPQVSTISDDDYNRIYQDRQLPKGKRLITFDDHVPFFLLQGSYNADSEDEEWMSINRNVNIDDFEHIIERLENASHTDIIHLRNARTLLQRFDPGLVDDVYDYWLQKRKLAASRKSKCTALIPILCTEQRRDEKTLVNPYIAFRRRLDKVQTRKKLKTDVLTYEKMLQLNLALKRSIVLATTLKQREKLKLAVVDIEHPMHKLQFNGGIYNEEVDELRQRWMAQAERLLASTKEEKTMQRHKQQMMVQGHSSSSASPSSIFDSKCLKRNLELWNSTITLNPLCPVMFPSTDDDSAEMEKICAMNVSSSVDGRYHFRRKYGCKYRAPVPSALLNDNATEKCPQIPLHFPFCDEDTKAQDGLNEFRCFSTKFSLLRRGSHGGDNSGNDSPTVGFVRRRMGRGGRIHIDLMRFDKMHSPKHDTN